MAASSSRSLLLLRNCRLTPTTTTTLTQKRTESTSRRLTKRLHLRPDASFLPLPSSSILTSQSSFSAARLAAATSAASAVAGTGGLRSSLIYNPPASMPSVYETPQIFLPAGDPRKQSSSASSSTSSTPNTAHSTTIKTPTTYLPPALSQPKQKKYHITPAQISEIRTLRSSDPLANSRTELSKKFGASRFFIGMVAEAGEKHKKEMKAEQDLVKESWGRRRTEARRERKRRREGWGGKDEGF